MKNFSYLLVLVGTFLFLFWGCATIPEPSIDLSVLHVVEFSDGGKSHLISTDISVAHDIGKGFEFVWGPDLTCMTENGNTLFAYGGEIGIRKRIRLHEETYIVIEGMGGILYTDEKCDRFKGPGALGTAKLGMGVEFKILKRVKAAVSGLYRHISHTFLDDDGGHYLGILLSVYLINPEPYIQEEPPKEPEKQEVSHDKK
jgi:hypothetical protein